MEQESKGLLLKHIKSGQYISDTAIDIQRMFDHAGMGLYAKPCCDRIEAAGLVDGTHVCHNYPSPWKLEVDADGMKACREILEAYLQPEELKEMEEALKNYWKWVTSLNNLLYALKKLKVKDLREGRTDTLGYKVSPDEMEDIKMLLTAELERRRLHNRLRNTMQRLWFTCRLLAMFRGPAKALFPFISLAWKSWEDNGSDFHVESKGKYTKALRCFTDAHGGTDGVRKLGKDDLARYIFLAVRAYGKENKAEYCHTGIKDCREVDRRYQELKQVMEAVGRMTPAELLRMYPVKKEYDGKKWGTKDYFYTMDKLKKRPADKPIGDAQDAACLLWDYQNKDLEYLLLQWINVLGDLHIYCNDSGPDDEFHERLLKKEA